MLVELARALRAEMADQRGGALWTTREARPEPHEETLESLLGRDDAAIVVGTIDGSIVGFGTVEVEGDVHRRNRSASSTPIATPAESIRTSTGAP